MHIKGFEGRSNFTSWLTRIAINSALIVLRKRRGGAEISIEQMRDYSENPRTWEPAAPLRVFQHTARFARSSVSIRGVKFFVNHFGVDQLRADPTRAIFRKL